MANVLEIILRIYITSKNIYIKKKNKWINKSHVMIICEKTEEEEEEKAA